MQNRRNLVTFWCAAAVLVAFIGACEEEPYKRAWRVQPPEDELGAVPVEPRDMGLTPGEVAAEGRHTLDASPSQGRFPTGLSVVQVVAIADGPQATRAVRPAQMAVDRQAYWLGLADDLPGMREVRVQRQRGLDPRGADHREILDEALKGRCNLCLVYARVLDSPADAEYFGVLYDARSGTALVAFRCPVELQKKQRKACDRHEHEFDDGECISSYLAEARLRQLVRDTLWDLAKLDQRDATTQPSPWQTDDPLVPRPSDFWRLLDRYGR
jgi:hypothetical protein